jgi:hypothetical protein
MSEAPDFSPGTMGCHEDNLSKCPISRGLCGVYKTHAKLCPECPNRPEKRVDNGAEAHAAKDKERHERS